MSSSMMRSISLNNSSLNIDMRDNLVIEVDDSNDDSDDNNLHIVEESIDESIEIDDSDEKAIDLSISSKKFMTQKSEETLQRSNPKKFDEFRSSSPQRVLKSTMPTLKRLRRLAIGNRNGSERSLLKPNNEKTLPKQINERSLVKTINPPERYTQGNGFAWTFQNVPNGDSNCSMPSINLTICDPAAINESPINESFIYQCEFCSDQFSSDQLLIDHCARMHTKDIKCQHCDKTFYWEKDLHFHMRKHIKKGRGFKCQICTGLFLKGAELKEHMKMHFLEDAGTEGSYPCIICDKKFKSNRTLQEHKRRFSHKQCEVCLEYFSSDATLMEHFSVHVTKTKSTYCCDQCEEVFPKKTLLKMHRDKHRLYVCELCSAEFRRKDDIKCHLRLDCTKRSLFNCSVCSKSFLSENSVKIHMNVRHYGRNKCEFCSEKFLYTAELVDHLKYHDIEHPYQCQICLAPMSSKRIFNFHLKSHNYKTKYKCESCCRWFQSGHHLQNHMKTHSKDTYKCTICTMSFSDPHRLEQHARNHEDNEFQCDICKRSFRTRHLIFLHMIDSHQSRKKCHICKKEFKNQRCLMTHLKSHYVKVEFPDEMSIGGM